MINKDLTFYSLSKSKCSLIQTRATDEHYFHVVLFIMLCNAVLSLSLWMISFSVTIQMKATEQYVPAVLFIMLHKGVLS